MKILKLLALVYVMICSLGVNAQTHNVYEQSSNLKSQTSNQREISNQRAYDILFHEAMLQRQKGHHTAAYDLLCRCVELNPQASEAYFFQAQYLMEIKEKTKALEAYKKAVDLNPDNMTLPIAPTSNMRMPSGWWSTCASSTKAGRNCWSCSTGST